MFLTDNYVSFPFRRLSARVRGLSVSYNSVPAMLPDSCWARSVDFVTAKGFIQHNSLCLLLADTSSFIDGPQAPI